MLCSVEGCDSPAYSKGMCKKHYFRMYRNGHTNPTKAARGTRQVCPHGYIRFTLNGKRYYEHMYLAEKALGRPLPKEARVHHTGARWDNHGPFKLVICPSQEYHALLHKRMRELGYENN